MRGEWKKAACCLIEYYFYLYTCLSLSRAGRGAEEKESVTQHVK
jgi:hypothetical protein